MALKIQTDFPHKVVEIENFWLTLADGTKLAARAWMPDDAERNPVPVVLQYMPYRKRDFTAVRDETMHKYFAGHGYAAVRVDQRGSGDSEGLMFDEYDIPEIKDGAEVIELLARMPWCSGNVGMLGNSWSGFNALQVATEAPPSLKAIITSCSTDDRYSDDMHYMGGCLLTDIMDWGTVFFGNFPRPPDGKIVGQRWRQMWQERLDNMPFSIETWLRHQRRDDYWKPGSACEDYSRIKCAVYACAGWLDGYSNTVARLLQNLDVPRLGLVGPWKHAFPHVGFPDPAYNWLAEAVGWWDHWLKSVDNGIMNLPMYRAYMQEDLPLTARYDYVPGRWVTEPSWPSPHIKATPLHLAPGRLDGAQGEKAIVTVRTPQTNGLAGGEWCPGGTGGTGAEFATDQREDDGKSVVFDSPVLDQRTEILGAPVIELTLASDKPQANLIARLCDVAPDGASARVSYGVLNLTHRESHEHPRPLEPGRKVRVRLQLNDCAHAFRQGHRMRLALSTTYWPLVWPSPEAATLTVDTADAVLTLPQRAPRPDADWQQPNSEPEGASPPPVTWLRPESYARIIHTDAATQTTDVINRVDAGHYRIDTHGMTVGGTKDETARIREGDPTSAEMIEYRTQDMGRTDSPIHFDLKTRLTCDTAHFFLEGTCDTYEKDKRIHSKVWNLTIPRDHV
ncbi:MAG: CocE/NonD family hydrolase [Alphaproteobacteria bacterium]